MKLDLYQIDSFTDKMFGGNPACVVPLEKWLPEELMLNIARENAVAETAFFVRNGDRIHLRWFTPEIEMDLCGHATLATAHCLMSILGHRSNQVVFDTLSGELTVSFENGLYMMDFPSRPPKSAELPEPIKNALNIAPKEVLKSRDYVLVYDTEADIRKITINRTYFDQINLDPGGVILTSRGTASDFVSRYFTPQASILEDPVTGSAHCSLIPFWADRLGRKEMVALQVSQRIGKLYCHYHGDRVLVGGKAKTYSVGSLWTE